ncbi:MAG TPA: dTDP-glucose 4,6-dehydratase [Rhabdochlamydiaceae bacterium]|nr:dTDP-glucose 4,6-dehydratase [Rhabdochlamydiaceae bacterium]
MRFKRILVTGGAGFIGSAFIRYGLAHLLLEKIVNVDLLTYAGCEKNMEDFSHDPRHAFVRGNICDKVLIKNLCQEHGIEAIVHFAAESHVDRSIDNPSAFLETNVYGTYTLLEVVRELPHLHFHHVSTDEVYGSLHSGFFNENSSYRPNSPYAASKAASDHFVRAWGHTYGLSTTMSHCTNNYGPYQHVEKFIPHMIMNCLHAKPLPVYGEGINVRDWLFVDDHAEALWMILEKGKTGEVYDIGGETEMRNIDLLHTLIDCLAPRLSQDAEKLRRLITFVTDRPGHDLRYAIDCSKIKDELGWTQRYTLPEGLEKTVEWYLEVLQ